MTGYKVTCRSMMKSGNLHILLALIILTPALLCAAGFHNRFDNKADHRLPVAHRRLEPNDGLVSLKDQKETAFAATSRHKNERHQNQSIDVLDEGAHDKVNDYEDDNDNDKEGQRDHQEPTWSLSQSRLRPYSCGRSRKLDERRATDDTTDSNTIDPKLEAKMARTGGGGGGGDASAALWSGGCGRVPIFEETHGLSINKSAKELADRADDETPERRILFGFDSTVGEWPWVAKLRLWVSRDSSHDCTGTLIDARWIITAAHCLGYPEATRIEATLGLYDTVVPDESAVTVKCDRAIAHPKASVHSNDLALLRLSKPVKFNRFIGPVCLPPRAQAGGGGALELLQLNRMFCYTIGYGLNENMGLPVKLQKLEIEATNCSKLAPWIDSTLTDSVCIRPKGPHLGGACNGDSGGADLCYDEHQNRWFIFGVVSFGPLGCNRESRDPADWLTGSMDLTKHRAWITRTMKAGAAAEEKEEEEEDDDDDEEDTGWPDA